MKYKLRAKIEQNGEAIKNGGEFEPIATDWMFRTSKSNHDEPPGQPITRIANRLNDLNRVIWTELGIGIRTPEGVCGWIGGERRESESLGIELEIRGVLDYFRGACIVKNHALNNIIVQHSLPIDFTNKVESIEADDIQDEFALFLSKIGEYSDTETPGKQVGLSDVYDSTKSNWSYIGKGPPGPRGR